MIINNLERSALGFLLFLYFSITACATEDSWQSLIEKASVFNAQKDYSSALDYQKRALSLLNSEDTAQLGRRAYTLFAIGETYRMSGNVKDAEPYLRDALLASSDPLSNLGKPMLMDICVRYGDVLSSLGKPVEAEKTLNSCLVKYKSNSLDDQEIYAKNTLAFSLMLQGKLADAEKLARALLTDLKIQRPEDNPQIANTMKDIALAISRQDNGRRLNESLSYLREALALVKINPGTETLEYAYIEDTLAEFESYQKLLDDAEKHATHALLIKQRLLGDNHPQTSSTSFNLGRIYFFQGKFKEAVPVLAKAHEIHKKTYGAKSRYIEDIHHYLVTSLRKLGKDEEASKLERETGLWIMR